MPRSIRRFLFLSVVVAGTALTACGGCDDEAGKGALVDGESCSADTDCLGVCGGDGVCEGGNNANVATNGATNGATNAATNGTTGPTNATTGAPDGTGCMSDADCEGICNSDSICVGGGLPDGDACQTDDECSGFCNVDVCAGSGSTVPGTNTSGQTLCNGEPCACDNGLDDDGDGLIDGNDPECTGAYDNDEGTFATGIPGDNKDPKWQDCFFDGNSGAGDDGCRYHTDCLTGDLPLADPDCSISQECFDFCRPRTPNGCDCFGCCGVNVDDSVEYVQIGADCSVDDIENCGSCVQTEECLNECGECELCLGKTEADLPDSCSTGGGFTGDPCTADFDCQGICGGSNTCEGFGGGGDPGDACMSDADCHGECGLDSSVCSGGGGFVGDGCTTDVDCQGVCGGTNTCEGYGGGGYNGDGCMADEDCRGVCGGNNTCESSGSGSGSGVQCEGGETPCPGGQSECPAASASTSYYCQQGCCLVIQQ